MQISTLLLTPVVRPAISPFATPSEETPFSYWSINLGFAIEGNLLLCSSYLPLGVHQQAPHNSSRSLGAIKHFSGAVAGEKDHFCKGSLSLSIFLFCFCFACFILLYFVCVFYQKSKKISYYYYCFCLLCFIKNPKKLVSIIAFIFVACIIFVKWIVLLLCHVRE